MYILTVKIAEIGTALPEGEESTAGHMWYSISDGNKHKSFGFAPTKPFFIWKGNVIKDDDDRYLSTYYTGTIVIKKEQYDTLNGVWYKEKYENSYYNLGKNNCIDFTWDAMQAIFKWIPKNYIEKHDRLPTSNADEADKILWQNTVGAPSIEGWDATLPNGGNYHAMYGTDGSDTVILTKKEAAKNSKDPNILTYTINSNGDSGTSTWKESQGEERTYGIYTGKGNDTIIIPSTASDNDSNFVINGGEGGDTYIINTGKGKGRINSSIIDDGIGDRVIVNGKDVASLFIRQFNSNTYTSGSHILTFNSSGSMSVDGVNITFTDNKNKQISPNNWNNAFGIVLSEGIGANAIKADDMRFKTVNLGLNFRNAERGAHIVGGMKNDNITGSSFNDRIETGEGTRSFVAALTGDDVIEGGSGMDYIRAGVSTLATGQTDNDLVQGRGGTDLIYGGTGADFLYGTQAGDNIETATASSGNTGDWIAGEDGSDVIYGSNMMDFLFGGAGSDVIRAGAGDDAIFGDGHCEVTLRTQSLSGKLNGKPISQEFIWNKQTRDLRQSNTTVLVPNAQIFQGWGWKVDKEKEKYSIILKTTTPHSDLQIDNANGGDDWIDAGAGNDYVDSGASGTNNVLIGGSGSDTLLARGLGNELWGGAVSALSGGSNTASDNESDTFVVRGPAWTNAAGKTVIHDAEARDTLILGSTNIKGIAFTADAKRKNTWHGKGMTLTLVGSDLHIQNNNGGLVVIEGYQKGLLGLGLAGTGTGGGSGSGTGGSAGHDSLVGSSKADSIKAGSGNDTVKGGAGNDSLWGDAGNDKLYGQEGNDWLVGGEGNDTISGMDGRDKLYGQDGNDYLYGGAGKDTLVGGAGADVFIFNTPLNEKTNVDTITDFKSGEDKIRLSVSIFAKLKGGWNPDFFCKDKAVASTDYIIYNTTTGALLYDADGNGSGAAPIQFATLSKAPNLNSRDFIVA